MTKNASFGSPLLLTKLYLSLTIDSRCRDYPLSIAIVWAQSKDMCRHDSLFVHRNAYRLYLTLQQEFCVPRLEQRRHRRALRSARRVHLFGQMYLDLNTSSPIFCLVFLKEKKQCTKLSSSSGQTQQTRKTHKLILKKTKKTLAHIFILAHQRDSLMSLNMGSLRLERGDVGYPFLKGCWDAPDGPRAREARERYKQNF